MRKVAGYDVHHMRKKYDVPSMSGNSPQLGPATENTLWPRGLGGILLQKERKGCLSTGQISLEMT